MAAVGEAEGGAPGGADGDWIKPGGGCGLFQHEAGLRGGGGGQGQVGTVFALLLHQLEQMGIR